MAQFFEIQNGDGRHLELWLLRCFDVTSVFQIKVAIFILNLAMIGQIVKKSKLAAAAILKSTLPVEPPS